MNTAFAQTLAAKVAVGVRSYGSAIEQGSEGEKRR